MKTRPMDDKRMAQVHIKALAGGRARISLTLEGKDDVRWINLSPRSVRRVIELLTQAVNIERKPS